MRCLVLMGVVVACGTGSGKIELDGTIPGGDTASTTDSDSGTDSDSDDTESDPEPEPEPEPEIDFSIWSGLRVLVRDDCEGVLSEAGQRYDEDWDLYDDAKALCPECDHFYRIAVSPGYVCDTVIYQDVYRGLDVRADGSIEVLYWSAENWDYLPLAEAEVDETTLTYEYTSRYWGDDLLFEGKIVFEEAD